VTCKKGRRKGFSLEGVIAMFLGIVIFTALAPLIYNQISIAMPLLDPLARGLLSIVPAFFVLILLLFALAYF
jgi:hypothetical protein